VALFSSLDISWNSPEKHGEHRAIKNESQCFRVANAKARKGTEQETRAPFRARVRCAPKNGSRIDLANPLVQLKPLQTTRIGHDEETRFDHFFKCDYRHLRFTFFKNGIGGKDSAINVLLCGLPWIPGIIQACG
jgi:hypothetical protein